MGVQVTEQHLFPQLPKASNDQLDIEGVLLTMYDSRLNLTVQVVDEVKKYFSGKIFT